MNSGYALLAVDTRTPNSAFLVDRSAVLFAERLKNACAGVAPLSEAIGTTYSHALNMVPYVHLIRAALCPRFGESTNVYGLLHEYHACMRSWLRGRRRFMGGRTLHEQIIRELYCIPSSNSEHPSLTAAIHHARMEKIGIIDGFVFDRKKAEKKDNDRYDQYAMVRIFTPKETPAP